ncbi:MAG: sodium:solute symporter family protein [Candidatus Thermoplasmatota archaeon]
MNSAYILMALGVWIFFGVIIAYYARKHIGITLNDFYLANKRLGGFISAMTYSATTYSAFMMIGLVGLVYSTGVGAFGFEITYLMFTVFLLIIFGPRFWSASKKYNYITPPEMMADRYNDKRVGIIASIIALVMLIPYASVQMMGAGYLFSSLSNGQIPFMAGVIFMAGFSVFTAVWAGMKSVSWTDAFQAITMIFSAIILIVFIFYNFYEGPINFFASVQQNTPELLKMNWDYKHFIGLTLPWAFFALANPQVSQRLFVSKNIESLKKMITYFSIFGLIYTVITTLLGFAAFNILPGLSKADQAMPLLLTKVPVFLALIIFVGIFAAASSTLGSIMLTLSSLTTRDIARVIKPNVSEKKELLIGKTVIILLGVVCILFSYLRLDLIAILSAMASGGLLVVVPSLIGVFFWKRGTAKGAIASMSAGGLVTGVLYFMSYLWFGGVKWWPSVVGFSVTVLLFVVVSFLTKPPDEAEKFIFEVRKYMEKQGF